MILFKKIRAWLKEKRKSRELAMARKKNRPYELSDAELAIPIIVNAKNTVEKIARDRCSLTRFGDGEFSLMGGGGIHFQKPSTKLAQKLRDALNTNSEKLLVALPDCFSSLDDYEEDVADFWRKWLLKKRQAVYKYLDMDRTYYSAFFTRVFMPYKKTPEHYENCERYFASVKQIWSGRDLIICEGEGTRFGLLNDLLEGSTSIKRILCPATNAFDHYEKILQTLKAQDINALFLIALGPTATALAYDLSAQGYQAIDIGHLDVEYEWFLRKDEKGLPLEHKYVDGSEQGRKIHKLDNAEYQQQIIERILG